MHLHVKFQYCEAKKKPLQWIFEDPRIQHHSTTNGASIHLWLYKTYDLIIHDNRAGLCLVDESSSNGVGRE